MTESVGIHVEGVHFGYPGRPVLRGVDLTVRPGELTALIARYRPDEVMITGMMHDHEARIRSLEIAASVLADLAKPAAAA